MILTAIILLILWKGYREMEKICISKATLGRLPKYLQFLKELPCDVTPYISATTIATSLSLGEVQVRKDLGAICGSGKPRLGYEISDLINCLENVLGYNKSTSAVLVGLGRLGRALLEYHEFEKYGIKIVAAFDENEQTVGKDGAIDIFPMEKFKEYCKSQNVQIGIITVSEDAAQSVCDKMLESGINAIWNFSLSKLNVPSGVFIKQENLALSLAYLNNQLGN